MCRVCALIVVSASCAGLCAGLFHSAITARTLTISQVCVPPSSLCCLHVGFVLFCLEFASLWPRASGSSLVGVDGPQICFPTQVFALILFSPSFAFVVSCVLFCGPSF